MPLEPIEELRAHATAVTIAMRLLATENPNFANALKMSRTTTDSTLQGLPVKDEFIAAVSQQLLIFSGLPQDE